MTLRIATFEFKDGARFQPGATSDSPKLIGQHIELLREQRQGELTPQDVVDDARSHNSPLHSFFEWDDGAAAEQFRLHQARGLIRAVVAVYVSDVEPPRRTRAYVHIPEPGAPHYRESTHALSHSKTRDLVLQRAWRELQSWKAKYKDLREFADLIRIVDEVDTRLPKSIKG